MNHDYWRIAYEHADHERKQAQEEALRARGERDAARQTRDETFSGRAALDYEVGRLQRLLAEALRERDEARREATELRRQLAEAGAIVQEIWDANEHLNISAETYERHRRGELTWWPATTKEKDETPDASKADATEAR